MDEKEIRFTKKRIDESWKQEVSQETHQRNQASREPASGLSFSNFVTSLGIQALMCMGELKAPGSEKIEINLEAAKETIDLLILLKDKTKGNLNVQEEALISSLIPDLQLKFVQHKKS